MKILHVNHHDRGGAANAAIRLHQALLNCSVDSNILFLKNSNAQISRSSYYAQEKETPSIKKILQKKITRSSRFDKEQKYKAVLHNMPKGYEGYSLPFTSYDISSHPAVKQADIIHLHWVSRFLDYQFFKKIKKPVVWTLHDMNPFLGGFHYMNDHVSFSQEFADIENDIMQYKKKALTGFENLHIVALSSYLKNISTTSALFNKYPHYLIPNSLDLDIFYPYHKAAVRSIWNLPEEATVFLFVSETLNNKRKGFDLLSEAIEFHKNNNDMVFCTIGQTESKLSNKIRHLGSIKDEKLMALAYSASDAFILPSREDNLPNTMLESLACGTPVITFSKGGMADFIESGKNGILIEEISSTALARAVSQFLETSYLYDRDDVRKFAESQFSFIQQAASYLSIYNQIEV